MSQTYIFDVIAENRVEIEADTLNEARKKLAEKKYEEIFEFYDIERITVKD